MVKLNQVRNTYVIQRNQKLPALLKHCDQILQHFFFFFLKNSQLHLKMAFSLINADMLQKVVSVLQEKKGSTIRKAISVSS